MVKATGKTLIKASLVSVDVTGSSEAIEKIKKQRTEKHWLAAYVRMHHEKKTRDALTALGIENFLPVQIQTRQWSDRKKKVEVVVLSMMIFVHVNVSERKTVLELPSVLRFLPDKEKHIPIIIPDEQMESFRFMLDYSDETVQMANEPLVVGERVKVIKGSLQGLEGELVSVDGKTKVAVRIDALGCAYVDMPIGLVEKVK